MQVTDRKFGCDACIHLAENDCSRGSLFLAG
jgi:hypothetical protein